MASCWGNPEQFCLCSTPASQARGPRATCGLQGHIVRLAMLLGNFQIIKILVI